MKDSDLPIAITCGDPAGIGIDILRKMIQDKIVPLGKFILLAPSVDFADLDYGSQGIDLVDIAPSDYVRSPENLRKPMRSLLLKR